MATEPHSSTAQSSELISVIRDHISRTKTKEQADEVIALIEALNEIDLVERRLFGDAVNAAIVRNVKASDLKGRPASVRGLARVLGLQPSTVRRRIAKLTEDGWLTQDDDGVRYTTEALNRGSVVVRNVLEILAGVFRDLGWGDFRPPS